jgi:hypothetical protein
VGGGVRSEREAVLLRVRSEAVEDRPRLNAGTSPTGIDLQDPVEVAGEVKDDGDVAALPCQAGAGASREDRRSVLPAHGDRPYHVLHIAWDDHTDRNLPVV